MGENSGSSRFPHCANRQPASQSELPALSTWGTRLQHPRGAAATPMGEAAGTLPVLRREKNRSDPPGWPDPLRLAAPVLILLRPRRCLRHSNREVGCALPQPHRAQVMAAGPGILGAMRATKICAGWKGLRRCRGIRWLRYEITINRCKNVVQHTGESK